MSKELEGAAQATVKATSTVLGVLATVAGGLVALSAVAFIVGLWRTIGYSAELGAPWFTDLLTSTQIALRSLEIITAMGIGLAWSVVMLADRGINIRRLRVLGSSLVGASFLLYLCKTFFDDWMAPKTIYLFAVNAAIVWAGASGIMAGQLVAAVADRNFRWSGSYVWLIATLVAGGLVAAPYSLGRGEARFHADATGSSLARVVLAGDAAGGALDWRLVAAIGDQLVLVRLDGKAGTHEFRLARPDDIAAIRAAPMGD